MLAALRRLLTLSRWWFLLKGNKRFFAFLGFLVFWFFSDAARRVIRVAFLHFQARFLGLIVGLSLFSYWSICTAPVRGGTYFSLPPQRKVSKRKRAQTASF
jgi:hypothetical protein